MDTMPNILASFGVITDLHYADHDDGTDFTGYYHPKLPIFRLYTRYCIYDSIYGNL